ncbi:MAG: GGDEF domain-containing protein, partial [Pseudomonadales bacterium]
RAELALQRSRDDLQAANAKLEALANTDPLTGLYNRRFLLARLAAEMDRHNRSKMTLGVLLLDLDHFKQVNDRFGHPVGDAVLAATARCMEDTARECDVVARFGGEEFAILVVDAQPDGPKVLARRLCEAISALTITSDLGEPVPVTTSIGCVNYRGGRVNGETLVKLADQALYAAKSKGRNRVEYAKYAPLPNATLQRDAQPPAARSEPLISN